MKLFFQHRDKTTERGTVYELTDVGLTTPEEFRDNGANRPVAGWDSNPRRSEILHNDLYQDKGKYVPRGYVCMEVAGITSENNFTSFLLVTRHALTPDFKAADALQRHIYKIDS